jgi:choline/glycine/proline betaine transport protein
VNERPHSAPGKRQTHRAADGRVASAWRTFTSHMEPAVFIPAAAVIVGFVVFGSVFSSTAADAFESLQAWITNTFGWFYLLTATALLIAVLVFVVSPMGRIKLGEPEDEPEFPLVTWFTMMLSAGMGIGIVFFGVAEPLQHFANPPGDVAGDTRDAALEAMRYSFFHWGFHPWAIYASIALPLAYFHFRMKLPLAPRVMLYPLIGDRIYGWPGHVVDTLCTVGTLFGVATSLGLGSAQINAGLTRIAGVDQTLSIQITIIVVITAMATISVVSGLAVGIRRLSEFNLALFAFILLFALVVGPTVFQLDLFTSGLGYFIQTLPETSLRVNPGVDGGWQATWTLFYWSWWVSWSPFVGVFTARISKGRTVREFVLTAMLVPSFVGFLWFAVVGGTGIEAELSGSATELAENAAENEALSLYLLLDQLPWSGVMAVLATVLIVIFFVTSSDSGSFVDDMVTSGGDPNPPRVQRVFWALSEGAVAITLLLAGGLEALRSASLTTGLPIAVFLLVGMWGLMKALRVDAKREGRVELEEVKG